jgi:3-hydroxybutyryl-CoA dehydrogenase
MRSRRLETISIIGAGTMGTQIALLCAAHGYRVWLFSRSEQTLQRATQGHAKQLSTLQQLTDEEKSVLLERIRLTTDLRQAAEHADLLIENAPEDLSLKRELFAQFDRLCPVQTILATNSSSLRASALEDVTRQPERVLNLHFVTPVWDGSCVELMRGTRTSDETIEQARSFARSLGLIPLLVQKESTGFLLGRIWRAVKKESLNVVEEGVTTHEDVDRAWMSITKMPIGPFGLMDSIGLDVVRDVEMEYYHLSGNEADLPPRVLLDKIERGELGLKTGKGFYSYPHPVFQNPGWLKGEEE